MRWGAQTPGVLPLKRGDEFCMSNRWPGEQPAGFDRRPPESHAPHGRDGRQAARDRVALQMKVQYIDLLGSQGFIFHCILRFQHGFVVLWGGALSKLGFHCGALLRPFLHPATLVTNQPELFWGAVPAHRMSSCFDSSSLLLVFEFYLALLTIYTLGLLKCAIAKNRLFSSVSKWEPWTCGGSADAPERGFKPDVVTFTSMMSSCDARAAKDLPLRTHRKPSRTKLGGQSLRRLGDCSEVC